MPENSERNQLTTLELMAAPNDGDQPPSDLDINQFRAAVALASGCNEREAAQLIGVNRTTIYRWHQQDDFEAEVNRLKKEYMAEARAGVRTLLGKAVKIMDACLDGEKTDPVQLRAAMFIVSRFAPRAHEPIGPSTPQGVAKMRKDQAVRMWTDDQLDSLRVVLP
jgi:hypothetical protein